MGLASLYTNTTGRDNTAVGLDALAYSTTGEDNTALGYQAGDNITTGSNNIVIGNAADASSATVDNEITLGDNNINKFRIPGVDFSISAAAVTNGACFYENAKNVTSSYTLSGSNAMAAGPITVDSGVVITVSSGDTLTIV